MNGTMNLNRNFAPRVLDPLCTPRAVKKQGLHFRLANGLQAALYRLDNKEVAPAAIACQKAGYPLQVSRQLLPDNYAIVVQVKDETIYLVYDFYYLTHFKLTIRRLINTAKKSTESMMFHSSQVVYRNEVLEPRGRKGKILRYAIENNVSPQVCALMFNWHGDC